MIKLMFACVLVSMTGFANEIDISIKKIPIIKQPKTLACWITVATMLRSWKDKKSYSIEEVIDHIGQPWKNYYEKNIGLPTELQDKFAINFGLKSQPPANYTLEAYKDLLTEHGPLWITTGDGFSAHARILVAINGDGTYKNTFVQFIDPATGKKVEQSALSFVLEFEEEAIIANRDNWENLRIQIYHY